MDPTSFSAIYQPYRTVYMQVFVCAVYSWSTFTTCMGQQWPKPWNPNRINKNEDSMTQANKQVDNMTQITSPEVNISCSPYPPTMSVTRHKFSKLYLSNTDLQPQSKIGHKCFKIYRTRCDSRLHFVDSHNLPCYMTTGYNLNLMYLIEHTYIDIYLQQQKTTEQNENTIEMGAQSFSKFLF